MRRVHRTILLVFTIGALVLSGATVHYVQQAGAVVFENKAEGCNDPNRFPC